MTPLQVGVVGCGIIAARYVKDAPAFEGWRPVACADLDTACAEAFADEHGLQRLDVEELIAAPDVDLVLNLTPPRAHGPLVQAALESGKHVYTEKPLAATVDEARGLVAEANDRGLRLGCAPDTFLGAAYSTGRRLLDDGAIGRPSARPRRCSSAAPTAGTRTPRCSTARAAGRCSTSRRTT